MLQIKNLSFSYNTEPVLSNLNLTVKKGEQIAVIGESGSGKSTLLQLIFGTYDLNNGSIFWDNTEILGPKYNLVVGYNFIKYVTQEFDLMPFISVKENVGKYLSNFFPKAKQNRINELLDVVELKEYANVKVKELSGGQKQRVAIARALAKDPALILLDEPFSHIDNFKKQSLRRSLFKYLREKDITCIMATHDKEDVLGYSDHIVVLKQGEIISIEKPENLYKDPKQPLIAAFFGEFSIVDNQIVYAHQLKVVDYSDLKVRVVKSYFKGKYYLIEAIKQDKTVYFEHSHALNKHDQVFLETIK